MPKATFSWYCLRGLGLSAICEKLNSDLDRFPPPTRNRKDENDLVQTWSKSQLHSLLRNPKYTGYNVWNRHDKRRGRPQVRPCEDWIWSATPTHEPIVSRELFDQVEDRARLNGRAANGSKPKAYPQRRKGTEGRRYLLRGRVRCGICGRRMEGSHQKHANWYRCQYARRRGLAAADVSGHPRSLGIKEAVVLDAIRDFMAERLFGPDRLRLLSEELATATDDTTARDAELERLRAEKEKIDKALYRQSLRLEEQDDPNHPIVKLATQRIEELSGQAKAISLTVGDLEKQRPTGPSPAEVKATLNAIPDLTETLENADDDELSELLNAFDVSVSYDKPAKRLELSAVIAPELDAPPEADRSGDSFIAGAGFEPATFGL